MESLNIAIYSDSFLPARDGVVTYILTLRRELERLGNNVYIVSVSEDPHRLKNTDENVIYARGRKFSRYPQYTISYFPFKVNKILLDKDIDIIHAQTPFSMGYSSLRLSSLGKIPAVSTFHSLVFQRTVLSAFLPDNIHTITAVEKTLQRYLKWHYSKFSALISPSDFIKNLLVERGIREAVTIANGIDLERYKTELSKEEARHELGIGEDEKIVLFLGRVSREKNLEILLQAAAINTACRFIVIGSGPQVEYYRSMTESLKLRNVEFRGFVEDKYVSLYLKSADVFCNPSNYEVLSTVDIEAMTAGTPILVPTSTSQVELTFEGASGETFKNGDPADLSAKLDIMTNTEKQYSPEKYAKLFTPELHSKKLLALYSSLVTE